MRPARQAPPPRHRHRHRHRRRRRRRRRPRCRRRRDGDDGSGGRGAPARPPPAPGTPWSRPSSARPWTWCPGPGGLAGFLRRRQLGARLGGPSLPLDVGVSTDIPAAIRRAVILRDQHCRFPGGCDQPAAACEIHHLTHKADGGKTSVNDCALFCTFHHQVVIHQWGWTVVLNPDGTTTAWNKDKTKILHSHSPPGPARVTPRGAQRRRFSLQPRPEHDRPKVRRGRPQTYRSPA